MDDTNALYRAHCCKCNICSLSYAKKHGVEAATNLFNANNVCTNETLKYYNQKPIQTCEYTAEVNTLLCANCVNTQIIERTTISVSTNVKKNLQQVLDCVSPVLQCSKIQLVNAIIQQFCNITSTQNSIAGIGFIEAALNEPFVELNFNRAQYKDLEATSALLFENNQNDEATEDTNSTQEVPTDSMDTSNISDSIISESTTQKDAFEIEQINYSKYKEQLQKKQEKIRNKLHNITNNKQTNKLDKLKENDKRIQEELLLLDKILTNESNLDKVKTQIMKLKETKPNENEITKKGKRKKRRQAKRKKQAKKKENESTTPVYANLEKLQKEKIELISHFEKMQSEKKAQLEIDLQYQYDITRAKTQDAMLDIIAANDLIKLKADIKYFCTLGFILQKHIQEKPDIFTINKNDLDLQEKYLIASKRAQVDLYKCIETNEILLDRGKYYGNISNALTKLLNRHCSCVSSDCEHPFLVPNTREYEAFGSLLLCLPLQERQRITNTKGNHKFWYKWRNNNMLCQTPGILPIPPKDTKPYKPRIVVRPLKPDPSNKPWPKSVDTFEKASKHILKFFMQFASSVNPSNVGNTQTQEEIILDTTPTDIWRQYLAHWKGLGYEGAPVSEQKFYSLRPPSRIQKPNQCACNACCDGMEIVNQLEAMAKFVYHVVPETKKSTDKERPSAGLSSYQKFKTTYWNPFKNHLTCELFNKAKQNKHAVPKDLQNTIHSLSTANTDCTKCALIHKIIALLLCKVSEINTVIPESSWNNPIYGLKINYTNSLLQQRDKLFTEIKSKINGIERLVHHKYIAATQQRLHDTSEEWVEEGKGAHLLICIDFQMTIKLINARQLRQRDFMENSYAINLGAAVTFYDLESSTNVVTDVDVDNVESSEKHDRFCRKTVFELYHKNSTAHNAGTNIAIIKHIIDKYASKETKEIRIFSDNGSNFHASAVLNAEREFAMEKKIAITHVYFEPGEGKTNLDRLFGRLKLRLINYLRQGHETTDLKSYLKAVSNKPNTNYYIFDYSSIPTNYCYLTILNIKQYRLFTSFPTGTVEAKRCHRAKEVITINANKVGRTGHNNNCREDFEKLISTETHYETVKQNDYNLWETDKLKQYLQENDARYTGNREELLRRVELLKTNYANWSCIDLRRELQSRSLIATGRKPELISRIMENNTGKTRKVKSKEVVYTEMNVADLREKLEKRKLKKTGNKSILIKRLEANDAAKVASEASSTSKRQSKCAVCKCVLQKSDSSNAHDCIKAMRYYLKQGRYFTTLFNTYQVEVTAEYSFEQYCMPSKQKKRKRELGSIKPRKKKFVNSGHGLGV